MAVPISVFIDTCIFEAAKYDYASSAFSSFCSAVEGASVRLLLPDPIEREVMRHLAELAREATERLKKIRREAPFVDGWEKWQIGDVTWATSSQLADVARREWSGFVDQFNPLRLGYDGLPMPQIMDWYDRVQPPFGKGKKRKEFPDAFALSMLVRHAEDAHSSVAVVSRDLDWQKACERYTSLMHFESLEKYTEAFLSSDNRMAAVRAFLDSHRDAVEEAIAEQAEHIDFHMEQVSADDVTLRGAWAEIAEDSIISLGETDFSVAFEAYVTVAVEYEVGDVDPECGFYSYTGEAEGEFRMTGTLKIALPVDPDSELELVHTVVESPSEAVGIDVPGYDWYDYDEDR